MKPFLDTNILVYAVSADRRREKALKLIESGGVISVQVLNEFANVLRKKLQRSWSEIETAAATMRVALGPALPLTEDIHEAALALAHHQTLSFYDALIVAAAMKAGSRTLLSEDMQQGWSFGTLTIVNPFGQI